MELAARADAGQKLGMQALEFTKGLAEAFGKRLDFEGAAQAMLNAPVVNSLSGDTAEIERRSRHITADILRRFSSGG